MTDDSDSDTEYFSLEGIIGLRIALSAFIKPSEEITKAIQTLDTYIDKTITQLTQET